MRACITIVDGPAAGKKLWLLAGQVAEIGRSTSVDLAVPQDNQLAEIHFLMECDQSTCRFRDISGGAGVIHNGKAAPEAVLAHGDSLKAGNTTFQLNIDAPASTGSAGATASQEAASEEPALKWTKVEAKTATEVCAKFNLDEGKNHIKDWYTPEQFCQVLGEKKCFPDAFRLISHSLTKEDAIWWAYRCNQESFTDDTSETDLKAQEATLAWLNDPSDENRRAAMKAAEDANCETAAALTGMAVFFSGGSMVAADLDPVPPGEFLTAQCVAGAVSMSSASNMKIPYPANQHHAIQLGDQVAKGESTWKKED